MSILTGRRSKHYNNRDTKGDRMNFKILFFLVVTVLVNTAATQSAFAAGTCRCLAHCGHNPNITAENVVVSESKCRSTCVPRFGACYSFSPLDIEYCGDAWTGYHGCSGGVGNPCPTLGAACTIRGKELGKHPRTVGFPPRCQVKEKFQCWKPRQ